MSKQSKTGFNNVTVLTLGSAILLVRVRRRHTMGGTQFVKEWVEFFILTTPISLDMNDFAIEKAFNMFLKLNKHIIDIRFMLKQIEPSKATESINKTHIETMSTDRCEGRNPNIRINDL